MTSPECNHPVKTLPPNTVTFWCWGSQRVSVGTQISPGPQGPRGLALEGRESLELGWPSSEGPLLGPTAPYARPGVGLQLQLASHGPGHLAGGRGRRDCPAPGPL